MVASLAELSPLLPDAAKPAAVEVLFTALPAIEDAGAHSPGRVCHYVPIFNLNVLGNSRNRMYL